LPAPLHRLKVHASRSGVQRTEAVHPRSPANTHSGCRFRSCGSPSAECSPSLDPQVSFDQEILMMRFIAPPWFAGGRQIWTGECLVSRA
jgi:hypothetical protein